MSGATRFAGIKARLALLALAIAAPAIAITAAMLALEHTRERARMESDSIGTARAMVHAIDRDLVSISAAAQALATSNRAKRGDIEGFYPQAAEIVAQSIGLNVVLSDTAGRQLLNTLRKPGERLPRHGNPAQLQRVVESARPVVSDLYVGGVLRRPVMSVDVPVVDAGRVVYMLSIGELPERFRTILSSQQLPAGWIGAVFDSAGAVVARTHEHERFVGNRGAPGLLAAMATQAEGVVETTTLEGIPVVSVFSRSAETGWTVALGIPRETLARQLWRRTWLAALAAVVILGSGLVVARAVAGRIADSIHGLVEPAVRIGRGESVQVPPLGLREADEVGLAMTRASELILSAEHRAGHDMLTGLANRELFLELARHEIETCKRNAGKLAVLFIDLDGFKAVNDGYGHEAGDLLLKTVASRLAGSVRGADIPARIGGDEFAVLLTQADAPTAAGVAAKLLEALSGAYAVAAGTVSVSASIGVAAYPEAGAAIEDLVRNADRAMYQAKSAGKGRYSVAGAPTRR